MSRAAIAAIKFSLARRDTAMDIFSAIKHGDLTRVIYLVRFKQGEIILAGAPKQEGAACVATSAYCDKRIVAL